MLLSVVSAAPHTSHVVPQKTRAAPWCCRPAHAGSNAMAGKGKAVVKPGGKGGKGRGAGRAPGGGKGRGGSIVKPGAAIKSGINRAAGAIGKKGKPRTVVVAGMGQGGRAPGGGKGRGGKGRGGKARGAGRAGLTLAQRFGGRGRK